MPSTTAPLVLASASPRRRAILSRLGFAFRVAVSGVDESVGAGASPLAYALWAAQAKARDVARGLRGEEPAPYVIGADTIVVVEREILGKPSDDAAARVMIGRLSGRWHAVTTAVVLVRSGQGLVGHVAVTTRVRFRELSPRQISAYVATGEGRDKAGAYAVQGVGRELIERLEGSHSNVVGLPAADTLELLARHRALEAWP